MSLIQEALKRQQEDGESTVETKPPTPAAPPPQPAGETAENKEILPGISAVPPESLQMKKEDPVPAEETAPPAPPPLPESTKEEETAPEADAVPPTQTPILEKAEKPNRNKTIALAVLILLLIVVGIKMCNRPSDEPTTDEPTPDVAVDEPADITPPVTEAPAIVTPVVKVEPKENPPDTGTTPPATVKTTPPAPEPIEWPSLTLTGVMGKGKKGSAMINGELIAVGDSVEGVEFVGVGKSGIYLQYKGESRFLKRGQTTF